MKKQKIQMAVMVLALIVVIGAYFGLKSLNKKTQEELSESQYTALNLGEDPHISELKVNNENGEFVLTKKDDGTYSLASDNGFDVNEDKITTKINSIKTITSEQIVENATNLEDFGLTDPVVSIELTLEDGSSHKIMIGDYNDVASAYYLMVDDDKTIYTVNSTIYTNFTFDAEGIRAEAETEEDDTSEE